MKVFKTKNGVYYGLTDEETTWMLVQEESLPQFEEKEKNMIYISHERMKALLDLRDETD